MTTESTTDVRPTCDHCGNRTRRIHECSRCKFQGCYSCFTDLWEHPAEEPREVI